MDKKFLRKLLIRMLIDVAGIAVDVYARCVWKPLNLPNFLAMSLSLAALALLLYDIARVVVTILEMIPDD